MSTVYLGRDEVLDRPVAVKILRGGASGASLPADADLGARFEREGRTAASLSHANVVQVYDAGKDEVDESVAGPDGREPGGETKLSVSYIVMEYVPGGDLKEVLDREGNLSGRRLARIGAAVASGLAHAHERGVIHRDIKPQNVLMDEYGNPKLTDFGIARALNPDGSSNATSTGHYLGTAVYSAPEQLNGEDATPKSDIYALGTTLYHAATGAPPFTGMPLEIATQKMNRTPAKPSEAGANLTPEIEEIILACLARGPDDRPAAQEVQRRLYRAGLAAGGLPEEPPAPRTGVLGADPNSDRPGGGPAETISLPTRTFQGRRDRGPLVVGAVAIVFLLAVLLGGFALLGGGNETSGAGNEAAGGAGEDPPNGGGASPGGEDVEVVEQEATQAEETIPPVEETTEAGDSGPLPPTDAAGQVVFDYYVALAEGRYSDAWASLSGDYREEVGGSVSDLEERESSLAGVFFDAGVPQAALDGREARVDFTATETRSGAEQTVSGTWVAVSEDGEWRLDRLE